MLYICDPKLIKEWHNEKNGTLTPNHVSEKSNLNVWWICPKGHDYDTVIGSRTNNTHFAGGR